MTLSGCETGLLVVNRCYGAVVASGRPHGSFYHMVECFIFGTAESWPTWVNSNLVTLMSGTAGLTNPAFGLVAAFRKNCLAWLGFFKEPVPRIFLSVG